MNDGLGNTIEDAQFFPDLPTLLAECADRLRRLLDLDRRLIAALHKVGNRSWHALVVGSGKAPHRRTAQGGQE